MKLFRSIEEKLKNRDFYLILALVLSASSAEKNTRPCIY